MCKPDLTEHVYYDFEYWNTRYSIWNLRHAHLIILICLQMKPQNISCYIYLAHILMVLLEQWPCFFFDLMIETFKVKSGSALTFGVTIFIDAWNKITLLTIFFWLGNNCGFFFIFRSRFFCKLVVKLFSKMIVWLNSPTVYMWIYITIKHTIPQNQK